MFFLQDSYHHNFLRSRENIRNAIEKFNISICPISSKAITFETIESVAAIRFAIHWIVKWKTAFHLREKYLRIQKGGFKSKYISRRHEIPVDNKELKELIKDLERIVKEDPDIQLFLSKTFYFHVGYGEMVKYKKDEKMSSWFPRNYAAINVTEVSEFLN